MNKIFAALDGMEIDKAIDFIDPIKDKLYGVKINHTLLPNLYEFRDYKVSFSTSLIVKLSIESLEFSTIFSLLFPK